MAIRMRIISPCAARRQMKQTNNVNDGDSKDCAATQAEKSYVEVARFWRDDTTKTTSSDIIAFKQEVKRQLGNRRDRTKKKRESRRKKKKFGRTHTEKKRSWDICKDPSGVPST